MRIEGTIAKVYPKQSGESRNGKWQFVDAVIRRDEIIIKDDGTKDSVIVHIVIRMWNEKADRFLAEKEVGAFISANVHPYYRRGKSETGVEYPYNGSSFPCSSWDPAPQV